jgi:integrase
MLGAESFQRPTSAADTHAADLSAARLLLERLGVSPADLVGENQPRVAVPTFTEYVPIVLAATAASSANCWKVYWRVLITEWSERRIDEPTLSELKELANEVQRRANERPNARGGHGAKSNFIDAVKYFYTNAIGDRYITAADNPAAALHKPRRHKSPRRALTFNQLTQINYVASTTGTDPALDVLILRLHTETACRRGGALALRPCDLDRESCTVRLREKGGTTRDQPVSPTLIAGLIAHTKQRNPDGADHEPLLRYRNGSPISRQRYDTLWRRLGTHLPWITTLGITAHWIRYTTLTWVERNFSYGVAAAYAGHTTGGSTGTTLTYVPASIHEIATALSALVGEPHPLAFDSL